MFSTKKIIDRAIFSQYLLIVPELNALSTRDERNERIEMFLDDLMFSCNLTKQIGDLKLNEALLELTNSILQAKQQELPTLPHLIYFSWIFPQLCLYLLET